MSKDDHWLKTQLSHDKREAVGSSPDRTTIFSSPVTLARRCAKFVFQQCPTKVKVTLRD